MAKQVINIGTTGNDGTGDKIRIAFNKVNQNFTELYSGTGFSSIVTWDGVSTITVPTGFSGKVLNFNNGTIVTYTVASF